MACIVGECVERRYACDDMLVISMAWTADANGDVTHNMETPLSGYLWKVVSDPGTVANAYSVTLTNKYGVDVLHASCATLAITSSTVLLAEHTGSNIAAVEQLDGLHDLVIGAAANEYGVLTLYIQPIKKRN